MTEGGRANYLVTLQEVTGSIFTMTAVSVVDFDGDWAVQPLDSRRDGNHKGNSRRLEEIMSCAAQREGAENPNIERAVQ